MIDERPLPSAEGSEKYVLSSIWKDDTLRAEAILDDALFHIPAHRFLFRAIRESKTADPVFVLQNLAASGQLDEIGGPATIGEIYGYAVGQHFDFHLERLRHLKSRRMAIVAAQKAQEAAFDISAGIESTNYLDALGGPISAVFDSATASEPAKDAKALSREFLEEFEKRLRGESLPMGFPFGIREIDERLNGIHRQHMGIISGRTGGGKSTLATQVAGNLALDGTGVLYLILERTESSAFERTIIQQSRCRVVAVKDPANNKPTKEEAQTIRRAIESISSSNFHMRKPSNRRMQTILAEIRRYVRLHDVAVVFLDQIGLVRGERQKGDSHEAEVRGVSNTLQELAHELNIAIVVMSQMNADGDTKGAKAVEEDADWNLSIIQEMDRAKENFREHKHVLIAKDSHNGSEGTRLPLLLNKENLRFEYGVRDEPEQKPASRWNR